MEVSYGHTVTSGDDDFVRMADEVGAEILEIGEVGSTLVDLFPIGECNLSSVVTKTC